jgi:hypothetical protein
VLRLKLSLCFESRLLVAGDVIPSVILEKYGGSYSVFKGTCRKRI